MLAENHYGLDPARDVSILPLGQAGSSRITGLDSGVVDAMILSVPDIISPRAKGYNELLFLGKIVDFPQQGFGASDKKIREQPDEVLRMVRATLRGVQFIADEKNQNRGPGHHPEAVDDDGAETGGGNAQIPSHDHDQRCLGKPGRRPVSHRCGEKRSWDYKAGGHRRSLRPELHRSSMERNGDRKLTPYGSKGSGTNAGRAHSERWRSVFTANPDCFPSEWRSPLQTLPL